MIVGTGVTVITAALPERAELLGRAAASVARQTFTPAEHLIRFDVHRLGTASTRNALLERVRTPWVAVLDDDDELLPRHLEALVERTLERRLDVVYSACGGYVPRGVNRPFDAGELRRRNFIPATALVRTEALRDVGGYRQVYAEDWLLWLELERAGARFDYVDEVTWLYHRSSDGKAATRPPNAREEVLDRYDVDADR
jgi:glycosyltransferase involved in cell wall biosynthesis